jgi:hypothetical protein
VQKNKCWPSQVRSGFFILLSKVVDVQLPTQDCSENISGYVHTSFVNPTLQQGNASKLHPFWPNNSEWHKLYNLFLPKINRHRASRILHSIGRYIKFRNYEKLVGPKSSRRSFGPI